MDQKAGRAQNISDKITDENFVFDNQDRNRGGTSSHSSLPTTVVSPTSLQPAGGLQKVAAFIVSKGLTTALVGLLCSRSQRRCRIYSPPRLEPWQTAKTPSSRSRRMCC